MTTATLNNELDISQFEICVPKTCRVEGKTKLESSSDWHKYLESLRAEVDEATSQPGDCETKDCFGFECWKLKGNLALQHALRVHRHLKDEFLRRDGVSGMDVGFAVQERDDKFVNLPAIRSHVSEKQSPRLLSSQGRSDLTSFKYLLPLIYDKICEGKSFREWRFFSSYLFRRGDLDKLKYREFKQRLILTMEGPERDDLNYPILRVRYGDLGCSEDPEGNTEASATNGEAGDDETAESKCSPTPYRRLTICGVPLDVIGADYRAQSRHRNRAGVFAQKRATSVELENGDLEVTGRDRVDPLVGGISIGSVTGQAGTLGAIVWDRENGEPCILGNWHVLAGSTSAEYGQPCYQPSQFDGGTDADVVAHLDRWHIGLDGDAALAKLSGARGYVSGEVLGMWHPIAGEADPELGQTVRKWGRTSGFTRAFVDGIELTVDIDYSGKPRRFEDQFHLSPLERGGKVSEPGDSGALVLFDCIDEKSTDEIEPRCNEDLLQCLKDLGFDLESKKKRRAEKRERQQRRTYLAVGMIFAGDTPGSPLGEFAIASKITKLAERLDFSLRPVYAPRSSFRSLVTEPVADRADRLLRDNQAIAPSGIGGDGRGSGPTPDPEQSQSGGGG